MTTIPEDVMQKAEAAYLSALHDSMAGNADYLQHVCLAILAEREHCADIVESFSPGGERYEYGHDDSSMMVAIRGAILEGRLSMNPPKKFESLDGWKPIETAPKDGSLILAYAEHWSEFHLVQWDAGEDGWREGSWLFVYPPNVWRSLPKPPVSSAKAEGATHD
jgi:hypothetical protein